MRWKLLFLVLFVTFSCRRTHECYVKDKYGTPHDTIICKCYKEVLTELETSPFITDTGTYETDTITYNGDSTITYDIICD